MEDSLEEESKGQTKKGAIPQRENLLKCEGEAQITASLAAAGAQASIWYEALLCSTDHV